MTLLVLWLLPRPREIAIWLLDKGYGDGLFRWLKDWARASGDWLLPDSSFVSTHWYRIISGIFVLWVIVIGTKMWKESRDDPNPAKAPTPPNSSHQTAEALLDSRSGITVETINRLPETEQSRLWDLRPQLHDWYLRQLSDAMGPPGRPGAAWDEDVPSLTQQVHITLDRGKLEYDRRHVLEVWICDDGPLMITWARPFSNDRYHISLSPTNASHVQAQTARSARIAFATGYMVNPNLVPPGLSVQASGQCGLHERNHEPEFLTRDGVAWTDTALGALAPEGLRELMTRNPDLNQWYLRNKVF